MGLSRPPRAITIDDVAEKAGVSAKTVSRVLNNEPNVRPAKRELVMKAARELAAFMDKIRAHVEKNAEYVGDRFAEEARAIHNKEAEMRQIYGETTLDEARALIEDGVAVAPIPAARRKGN